MMETPITPGNQDAVLHLDHALPEADQDQRLLPPVLLQYWHTIRHWRKVLLGIIGAAMAVGLLVTLIMPPLYTARAQIDISRQQKKVTNVAALQADDTPQDTEFYSTQYALLKAQSLGERITKSLHLADDPAFYAAHGKRMPDAEAARQIMARQLLLSHVAIDPVRSSRLIDIKYTSRSATLSATIANAWVHEFIGATTDREYESTAQARNFLENRLEALRAKLEQSEENAANFAAANNIVVLETQHGENGKDIGQRTLSAADLEQLNTALLSARADRIAAEARAGSARPDITADALNNASIGLIKERRAEVAAEYAKVLTQFEPQYPAARALKEQLDQLDGAIAKDTARFGAERTQSYREAVAREKDLLGQVNGAKAEFDRQNHANIQYSIFERDADTNRQLYDGLLQRYKEIAEAGDVGASNIAIVDLAEVPSGPSAPNLVLNLAVSLLIGMAIAAAAVLALEQVDEGIRSPSDVSNLLKLPLLGNVPMTDKELSVALADPKSTLNEAYLSIRSNLAFSTNHGLPRSLAFTSAQPAEGKSTSALAISEIIGRTGKSVVLIDGDLRSPSVHKMNNLPNTSGLSNLLTGEDDVFAPIQSSGRKGLSLLTAGPLPPNPAELLSSDRLSVIVTRLLTKFDHVVIDSPPVLGLADAPLIGRAVEGMVFIAEPGRSPLRGIRSALQRLRFVGARLFGVIITKIDIDNQHYGYSYGYGYGYGRYGKYGRYGGYGYGYSYGDRTSSQAAE